MKQLSKALTAEFGKGFSRSNLQNMRALYLNYENCQSLTGKLTWTHYCELLSISDKNKRSFYEKEAINVNWSVRELKRQIEMFLLELGRGFMFVGTQQRITINMSKLGLAGCGKESSETDALMVETASRLTLCYRFFMVRNKTMQKKKIFDND